MPGTLQDRPLIALPARPMPDHDPRAVAIHAEIAARDLDAKLESIYRASPLDVFHPAQAVRCLRQCANEIRRMLPRDEALEPLSGDDQRDLAAAILDDPESAVAEVMDALPEGSAAFVALGTLLGYYLCADGAVKAAWAGERAARDEAEFDAMIRAAAGRAAEDAGDGRYCYEVAANEGGAS